MALNPFVARVGSWPLTYDEALKRDDFLKGKGHGADVYMHYTSDASPAARKLVEAGRHPSVGRDFAEHLKHYEGMVKCPAGTSLTNISNGDLEIKGNKLFVYENEAHERFLEFLDELKYPCRDYKVAPAGGPEKVLRSCPRPIHLYDENNFACCPEFKHGGTVSPREQPTHATDRPIVNLFAKIFGGKSYNCFHRENTYDKKLGKWVYKPGVQYAAGSEPTAVARELDDVINIQPYSAASELEGPAHVDIDGADAGTEAGHAYGPLLAIEFDGSDLDADAAAAVDDDALAASAPPHVQWPHLL
eukprot:tig00021043_g17608.t1